ncbi:DUF6817 domain-containing protein [Actinomadura atramentaria]|uniref:DUF6817 domain-containing protein n=1 Tax=Actinomadura atramentaria TaxID=1990 RepID=UPI00039BC6A3|nr:hypothetical protein [Actinomadura atramentaria]
MSEEAARALLAERGARDVPHPGGTLAVHLDRVNALLADWGAGPALRLAGLCHAFYGTDGFPRTLGGLDQRDVLAAAIGHDAEAIVRFYAGVDRAFSYPRLLDGTVRDRFTGEVLHPPHALRCDFAELTAANEIDVLRHDADLRTRHGAALRELFTAWFPLLSPQAQAAVREM